VSLYTHNEQTHVSKKDVRPLPTTGIAEPGRQRPTINREKRRPTTTVNRGGPGGSAPGLTLRATAQLANGQQAAVTAPADEQT